jgi:hypothetical protein
MNTRAVLALVVTALLGQVEVYHPGGHVSLAAGEKRTFVGPAKAPFKKPSLAGTIVAVSADGKTLTLETPPAKKGQAPGRARVKVTADTKFDYFGVHAKGHKPTAGYRAFVWLKEDSTDIAERIRLGLKPVVFTGTISAVSAGGKELTLEREPKSKGKKNAFTVKIVAETKLVYKHVKGQKPVVGYFVQVWLQPGSKDVASGIVFYAEKPAEFDKGKQPAKGKQPKKPLKGEDQPKKGKKPVKGEDQPKKPTKGEDQPAKGKKPVKGEEKPDKPKKPVKGEDKPDKNKKPAKPNGKVKKLAPDQNAKKFEEPDLPPRPARPARDPAPLAGVVDAEVNRALAARKIPASPLADDAEFLRRVTLDLTGRVPTYKRTVAFLHSKDPDKRRVLIDELLERRAYGEHFGTLWRNLLAPPQDGKAKYARDAFSPWLAEQFNKNRAWNAIVTDLLTVEGPLAENPQSAFLMANSEHFNPQANRLAGSVARHFWGVQLRCAECHDHPYARWKQADFWGTAAFFGRLRFTGFKGKDVPPSLTEEQPDAQPAKGKGKLPPGLTLKGTAIVIPAPAGRAAGRTVPARFLGGSAPDLSEAKAWRPRFAKWATGAENPYFAKATANRLWAHLFGRGLVHPVDKLDTETASHPALLDRLARELAATNFDLKHLLRVLCNSKAYQRTSRPAPGNEKDATLFSHMTPKVMTPEVLYDSLEVVFAVDKNDPHMRKWSSPKKAGAARAEFAAFFRPQGEGPDATVYTHGIPHLLRLLNAPLLNRGAPLVEKLRATDAGQDEAITALYLAALARRPAAREVKLMKGYLARRKDARSGYNGVLWILLNSSEFVLNH